MSRLRGDLETEVARLKEEKRQLELHLLRTDAWSKHLGKWTASISESDVCCGCHRIVSPVIRACQHCVHVSVCKLCQVSVEEGKKVTRLVIVVRLPSAHVTRRSTSHDAQTSSAALSTYWLVQRKPEEFKALHKKLAPV